MLTVKIARDRLRKNQTAENRRKKDVY